MNDLETGIGQDSVAVVIATCGRPELAKSLVRALRDQTRPPDAIFVVACRDEDVAGFDKDQPGLTVSLGRRGLPKQRNDGLALAAGRFSYVVFFDDDFVPSRYWIETMVELFKANPDLVSLTGTVLADGIKTAGIPQEEAERLVQARDASPPGDNGLHDGFGPYGCNMAFRYAAIGDVAFDERLPLYGWLEDCDFGGQIKHRGRQARADALWGVHLGHKVARTRGVTLGYSQMTNAVYLARKGTLSKRFLANIALRNLLSNLLGTVRPEPFVDRRGRLYGNFIALADIMRGRITPERAADL
ncbi:glycosyltransferase family 2 protein [Methyloferula stellata]|uniref:glycosyltransferase family 2 protein n=1 Tax=Methyloferula stellata TaxID=876270 RepID=UPI000379A6C9|nr:glycosyltransferase [Methyloferula stellata]